MNKILKIEGLDCANCARELEEEVEKIDGVSSVTVDFLGSKVILDCAESSLDKVIDCCNHFEEVKVVDDGSKSERIKIEGLDCANCARELEEELNGLDGVSATVDFMNMTVVLKTSGGEARDKAIYAISHFEEVKIVEEEQTVSDLPVDGKRIKIENLCCANCGRELEEELNGLEGVSATVDFMNMTVVLKAATKEAYDEAIYHISHFEDVRIVDGKARKRNVWKENFKDIISVIVSFVLFVPAFVLDMCKVEGAALYVAYGLYGAAFLAAGYIVLWNTCRNVAKGKIFDENFLMTIASIGAIVLGITTGKGFFEGVAVMLLYRIGELLQSIAVGSSRRSITNLMDLKSETATLLKDGEQVIVAPEALKVGDIIIVKAGEKIPVDSKVVNGSTSLDLKSLNGESIPREVCEGDEILSGSINLSGVIEAEVIREYKNSAVAKILELVENSTATKAPPEKFITKFAKYYTPAVVIAAVLVAALVPTIICAVQSSFVWATYLTWIYKALSFLVISCPCALVISVPLSYFGGIGRCAKSGILVKGSTSLDELARATIAAFDKTGTLTEGKFAVKSSSSDEALKLAACAEKFSSHPIAAAFAEVATPYTAKNAEEIAGRGVKCLVDGKTILCGNATMLRENGVSFEEKQSVSTLVYVAADGKYIGVIEIDDKIKNGAKSAIEELRSLGVLKSVMLTGDGKDRAAAVAEEVGLDGFEGALLPDEKLEKAKALREEGGLIYVGDGINDAPVMTVANCAVSMGQVGSDAAIEASDIVLVSDKLSLLPEAKKVAKKTRTIVFENIIGSLAIKLALMVMGVAIPSFPLIVAIFGDVGVMLLAVLNAMRTARIK